MDTRQLSGHPARASSSHRGRFVPRLQSRTRRFHGRCRATEGELMFDRVSLLRIAIAGEEGVVAVRQKARRAAELLGLDSQNQIRFATAASEIGRNALTHGKGGVAEFFLEAKS